MSSSPLPLPSQYGVDRVVAIPRDSQRLFVLWEITADGVDAAKASLGRAAAHATLRLRLTDEEGDTRDELVGDWIAQRTVGDLRPGGCYVATLGWLGDDSFAPVASSLPVQLPG